MHTAVGWGTSHSTEIWPHRHMYRRRGSSRGETARCACNCTTVNEMHMSHPIAHMHMHMHILDM